MNSKTRQQVYEKYGGRCAYTGKTLGHDWQIDHVFPLRSKREGVNKIENLLPSLRIVNHYKRGKNLESFRRFMKDFHKRLAGLPKKTSVEKTKRRIAYMQEVAEAFDITIDKPFSGKFYFETI